MRYLDTKSVAESPGTQQLTAVRERLVQEIRAASGKSKGKGKAKDGAAGAAGGELQTNDGPQQCVRCATAPEES